LAILGIFLSVSVNLAFFFCFFLVKFRQIFDIKKLKKKKKKKTLVLISVLHMDVPFCQGCHYFHLWVTEEWTFFIMMALKTTCSSWGNGSAPLSESSTSFQR
jgi:hypothetical protein